MTFKLSPLTNADLERVIAAADEFAEVYDLLAQNNAIDENEAIGFDELADACYEELSDRAMEDAGYIINEAVARGELDRYMRPDGQIGYAPPGAWDELEAE